MDYELSRREFLKLSGIAGVAAVSAPLGQRSPVVAAGGVSLTDNGTTITLANGVITATITKSTAKVTSLLYNGFQMVNTASNGYIYFSMDGGASYEQPSGCSYSLKTQTDDLVDVGFKRTFSNQPHAVDIEIHFAMRSGDSGVYTYAILDHPASYPATSIGEWRVVWKLPADLLERIYVDDARNWEMPSSFDFAHAEQTSIAEVVRLTTGVRAGLYDCKYEFSARYWELGTWGHASTPNQVGAWLVFGSHEFFNDGPTKQDLTSAAGIIHVHFGMNHYNGSPISLNAGENWRKIFGPYLIYCNSSPAGGDGCWADANSRVEQERAAWPYTWLTDNPDYPPSTGRGVITGRFVVNDLLRPTVSGAGAWVGVAQPDAGGNWQFESKRYQFWARTDATGNFTIPFVRAGTYTLYAFTTGAVGEYALQGVNVSAGGTTALGDVTWNVPHPGSAIAWEIGFPDRTASKFWHGNDYFQPFLWDQFPADFPTPLEYTVGVNDWRTDWNYAHSGYPTNWSPWPWRINFYLDGVPTTGTATLTLALASANSARVDIFVNDETTPLTRLYPPVSGGNALIREGIHAKYGVSYVAIPVALLQPGFNTITLVQGRSMGASEHVMYDYINLELPAQSASPSARPAPLPSQQAINAARQQTLARQRRRINHRTR
jgi:rhamnogalacturonan endolyase